MSLHLTEEMYCLALIRAPGIGPKKFAALVGEFGSAKAVFSVSANQLKGLIPPGKALLEYLAKGPDRVFLRADLDWLTGKNHKLLVLGTPDYPSQLAQIHDPPPVLYVKGDYALLQHPQIAIVGSRSPTPMGKVNAYEFARNLSTAGFTITSGMAIGIDSESHRGALDGLGSTIAVVGCGLDIVYPKRLLHLAVEIAGKGALVSEFPIGTPPDRKNFPRRNRIISGLALGTLVVEASLKSGSLITARLASEQGRDVFAIPGSIRNPLSRGCHSLIKQGAKLVESAEDIGQDIAPQLSVPMKVSPVAAGSTRVNASTGSGTAQVFLETMGFDPISVDHMVEISGLPAAEVSGLLLQLELEGFISQIPGGQYVRK